MPTINPVGLKFMQAIITFMMMMLQVVCAEEEIMCIEREREALLQFKDALVDDYGMLSSWTTSDCCQWQGIRCTNLTAHVLMLDLHGDFNDVQQRYMRGEIHKSLMELQQLNYLNLNSNDFQGRGIPEFLGSLTNLRYLDLSFSHFGGKIPTQFGSLSHLKYLDLSWNRYMQGSIPRQLGNLSQLQHLDLSYNFFEGSIPSQLGNLSNLQKLYLGGSHYYDDAYGGALKIDDGDHWLSNLISLTHLSLVSISNLNTSHSFLQMIAKLPKLRELSLIHCSLSDQFILSHLDLSHNMFKGEDLKSFANICTLHSLYMPANHLTEDLPSILHNLSSGCVRHSLQDLDLSDNQITGSLPDLSVFSSLKSLFLDGNQLSGKIPEGISLPFHLEFLSISSNSLEGGIPKSFGNACALRSLDMSNNSLSEEFPMIIHHLSGCARYSLERLNLGKNQINGTLHDLSIFSSLRELYLDGNKLNGEIPKDIKFPPQLEELDLQSNSLKGVLTDYHFANMSKLDFLELSDNSLLALAFSPNWVPPFQLSYIGLRSCKLGPVFPKWWFWAKLTFQESILMNISHNNLHGIIPNFPLKNLYHSLILGSNQFDGPIPPFLRGSLFLDLSKNKFSDSRSFLCMDGTVENLYQLDLSNNHLSGKIPDCWSHFKSLSYLDLSHNNFSGRIPTSMGSLLRLQALLLRNNNLTDEIHFSLSSCTNLVMLDIAQNRLSGLIPAWVGSELQELQFLSLGRNNFHGSLPLQICYLSDIQLLDLSRNSMSGQIPKCIKFFTSMTQKTSSRDYQGHSYEVNTETYKIVKSYDLNALLTWKGSEQMFKNNVLLLLKSIDLSSNHFSGEIPLEIDNLFGLVSLNLSRNSLIGKIPSKIGKLTSLESLDLSRNQLIGSIPPSLTQIYGLGVLDLSHNHLTGKIPTSTQLQSFNASSYEDNLDLCGLPLEKLCIDKGLAQEPNVEVQEDEYSLFNREFYLSMTFGFVISFWVVFGSILFKLSWRHAYFKFLNNLSDNIYVKHLDLSINQFEGNIPSQIGNLSQLLHLDLSYNSSEGSIPSQLGNLSNLHKLYLGGSFYDDDGALKIDDGDHWLSNLISLTHLSFNSISNLNTSHSFLQMIAKLPKLRELSLSNCSLSDHFILPWRPSKFNFSSSLSVLDLYRNRFTSSMIHQWLSNVTSNLVELDLSHNLLEGSTSNHFGRVMNSLEHLDLSHNIFKGEDLKSFANICTLHSLCMPANHLTEDLPSILHNLSSGCVRHSLQDLDLSDNQITGSLPDLSVFSSLRSLVLDGNKLSGKIPEGICLPFHLEFLSIQSNTLEGGIPKSFGNACIT
ncbi:LOW QUALITY PROTEIN: receptor-like protein EIX2 [Glycine max]|uniref:LOW QUALITY PROTEIN: receptor-like protein EIX2 n=1 Tax=Glycine max TaxID=3847 RepID=UPI000E21B8C6|nr:LOW QUALITY PROTEIN: receptor-like protein EIX2 [Glycine max]|eukprot:XP_025981908.1 LOW QUALITY PROTEIN: receptor-like protein EIX2 [Glycine max]